MHTPISFALWQKFSSVWKLCERYRLPGKRRWRWDSVSFLYLSAKSMLSRRLSFDFAFQRFALPRAAPLSLLSRDADVTLLFTTTFQKLFAALRTTTFHFTTAGCALHAPHLFLSLQCQTLLQACRRRREESGRQACGVSK